MYVEIWWEMWRKYEKIWKIQTKQIFQTKLKKGSKQKKKKKKEKETEKKVCFDVWEI